MRNDRYMHETQKALVVGAAGMILAAGGALPALAAQPQVPATATGPAVGSVFSGTIEIASTNGLLVQRRQRKQGGSVALINVDTDAQTVVSRAGQALSVEDLSKGAEVIVSGTRTDDGAVLASKILIRA